MIISAFNNAWKNKTERKWDKIYILVDVHGVIMVPNYKDHSTEIYKECLEPLVKMTNDSRYCLILWTASSKEHIEIYLNVFNEKGIKFDYINSNPEVTSLGYGDYSQKLYANVILDDKAGFDPKIHWNQINQWLNNPGKKIVSINFLSLLSLLFKKRQTEDKDDTEVKVHKEYEETWTYTSGRKDRKQVVEYKHINHTKKTERIEKVYL